MRNKAAYLLRNKNIIYVIVTDILQTVTDNTVICHIPFKMKMILFF